MYKNTKALEKLIEQYLNDIDNRTNSFCNAYHLLEREGIFKDDITKDIFGNMSEPASRYGGYLKDIGNYMCHEDEIYNIAKEVKRKYDNLK